MQKIECKQRGREDPNDVAKKLAYYTSNPLYLMGKN